MKKTAEKVAAPKALAIGDTVMLKSGGPRMTVSEVKGLAPMVECQWFAECDWTKKQTDYFRPALLQRVSA